MEYKMRKLIITTIISTFLFSVPTTTIFNVEGMSCASGCAPKVNKAAMEIVGVESCDVNFIDSKAVITYDSERVSESNILEALKANTTYKYNLNKDIISRHPFPGPGLAIRMPGLITREKIYFLISIFRSKYF